MRTTFAIAFVSIAMIDFSALASAEDGTATDDALLEDLGAELLKLSTSEPPASLDEHLLEQLGEDVGGAQPAKDHWLSKVVKHMQIAQNILERSGEFQSASSAQTEALTGLDAMIAELTERQSLWEGGEWCGGKYDKPGQPKPGQKPESSGKAGKSPAKVAAAQPNSGVDLSTELAVAGELVKDLWGQLPERQREQILQPLSEEFLPKYASEIEAYFRALADPNRSPPESR